MAARTLVLTADIRCLLAGLTALLVGGAAFVVMALLAMLLPSVSGGWRGLPCAVMLAGTGAAGAWLIFGEGAQRFDPAPVVDQDWHWSTERALGVPLSLGRPVPLAVPVSNEATAQAAVVGV